MSMGSGFPVVDPDGDSQPLGSFDANSRNAVARPTRSRFIVLLFLCTMTLILYLDRICLGQAIPAIKAELALNDAQISYIAVAFTLAYALFEVPVGRWGD